MSSYSNIEVEFLLLIKYVISYKIQW